MNTHGAHRLVDAPMLRGAGERSSTLGPVGQHLRLPVLPQVRGGGVGVESDVTANL